MEQSILREVEAEQEGSAVIKQSSKSSCQMYAIINGRQADILFRQHKFYSFGMPFRGNMAKALPVGTQVKFSYTFESDQDPMTGKLWAVWIGDKPKLCDKSKVLYSDPPLEGVFGPNPRGREGYRYLQYANTHICVKQYDVYDDGQKCTGRHHLGELTRPGETVNFEAVLAVDPDLNFPLSSGKMKYTHEAVCVWIGEKPSLKTVASSLPWPNRSLLETKDFLLGTVSKLYLPAIALISTLPGNQTVCVHSNEFHPDGNHIITDFVSLGDCLKFKVVHDRSCPIFIRAVNVSIVTESELRTPKLDLKEAPCKDILFDHPPLSGIVSSVSSVSPKIAVLRYRDYKVLVAKSDFYVDSFPCTEDQFISVVLCDCSVYFEAVSQKQFALGEKTDFYATCAWIGEKPTLPLVASRAGRQGPEIAEIILSYAQKTFLGIINKICLPDVALIEVKLGSRDCVVDVHVNAFSDVQDKHITDFVDYGYVQFKVKRSDCLFGVCAYDVEPLTDREFFIYAKSLNRWQIPRKAFFKK